MKEKVIQFIKFGMVGILNTVISYVVYAILVNIGIFYLLASIAGFFLSVLNSFYWNQKFVFKLEEGRERNWWKTLFKTFMAYAGTGLILSNILLWIQVDILKVHQLLAPIINLIITIPTNYLLNKYWAYKSRAK